MFASSTTSSISLIYCGSNILSQSSALTNPTTVKAYVTNIYPKNTQVGGIEPELLNDNTCVPYYNFDISLQVWTNVPGMVT